MINGFVVMYWLIAVLVVAAIAGLHPRWRPVGTHLRVAALTAGGFAVGYLLMLVTGVTASPPRSPMVFIELFTVCGAVAWFTRRAPGRQP